MPISPQNPEYYDNELIEFLIEDTLDAGGMKEVLDRSNNNLFRQELLEALELHGWLSTAADYQAASEGSFSQPVQNIIDKITRNPDEIPTYPVAQKEVVNHSLSRTTLTPTHPVTSSGQRPYALQEKGNKSQIAIAVLLSCLILGCFMWFQNYQKETRLEQQKIARIQKEISPNVVNVTGQVFYGNNEQQNIGSILSPGSSVETSAQSTIQLAYPDQTTIMLASESLLKVNDHRQAMTPRKKLTLSKGKLSASVSKQAPDAQMVIKTPHANAEVLGTEFDLEVKDDRAELKVYEGSVLLYRPSSSKRYAINAGHVASLGKNIKLISMIDAGNEPTKNEEENPAPTITYKPIPEQPQNGVGQITSFILINVDTGQPITGFNPIVDGATIDLAALNTRNINIEITTTGNIDYVEFKANDEIVTGRISNGEIVQTQFEQFSPYTLAGDHLNQDGEYNKWLVGPGTYEIYAKPYLRSATTAISGTPASITIHIK